MPQNRSFVIFGIGVGALLFGLAIYMFARGSGTSALTVYLERIGMHYLSPSIQAFLPGWLPCFLHVFGFSLITNALLTTDNGFSEVWWVTINLILEIAQWDALHLAWIRVNDLLGIHFDASWIMRGTFSFTDLVGIFAGGISAYITTGIIRCCVLTDSAK